MGSRPRHLDPLLSLNADDSPAQHRENDPCKENHLLSDNSVPCYSLHPHPPMYSTHLSGIFMTIIQSLSFLPFCPVRVSALPQAIAYPFRRTLFSHINSLAGLKYLLMWAPAITM